MCLHESKPKPCNRHNKNDWFQVSEWRQGAVAPSDASGNVVIKPLAGQGQPAQTLAASEEEEEEEDEEEGVLGSFLTCIVDHAIICCHATDVISDAWNALIGIQCIQSLNQETAKHACWFICIKSKSWLQGSFKIFEARAISMQVRLLTTMKKGY